MVFFGFNCGLNFRSTWQKYFGSFRRVAGLIASLKLLGPTPSFIFYPVERFITAVGWFWEAPSLVSCFSLLKEKVKSGFEEVNTHISEADLHKQTKLRVRF